MLDLSMELGGEDGMIDNGNKGSFLIQGNPNRLTASSRLMKQKSSGLLGERGRGSS